PVAFCRDALSWPVRFVTGDGSPVFQSILPGRLDSGGGGGYSKNGRAPPYHPRCSFDKRHSRLPGRARANSGDDEGVSLKRTVIITGGTKGLGREMSLAFGRAGYCVLALYSSDEAAAQKLDRDLLEINAPGFALRHDVRAEDPSIWTHGDI